MNNLTEAQQIAEKLAAEWIATEGKYRSQVIEARVKGTSFSHMSGHADGVRECRYAIQKAFGLTQPID